MAQLHKSSYEFPRKAASNDWQGEMREEEAELIRLMKARDAASGSVKGAVLSFPVADGKAHYLVTSEKPLVLQHIPFFDGYAIDAAMLRGLRLDDVKKRVENDAWLRSMLSEPAATPAAQAQ